MPQLPCPFFRSKPIDGTSLDGKTNLVEGNLQDTRIEEVFLKNVGDRRAEIISIRFSLGCNSRFFGEREDWEQVPAGDNDFKSSFISRRTGIIVAPGQKMNVHRLSISDADLIQPVPCELEVFYGGEQLLRTRFFIKKR